MLTVVHILGSLPPLKCGVGDSMSKISFYMAKRGIETHIITSENVHHIEGVNIHPIMRSWTFKNQVGSRLITNGLCLLQPHSVLKIKIK